MNTSLQVSADKQVNLDEESWMTVQVLAAVHPINTLTDEHQQEILKVETLLNIGIIQKICDTLRGLVKICLKCIRVVKAVV